VAVGGFFNVKSAFSLDTQLIVELEILYKQHSNIARKGFLNSQIQADSALLLDLMLCLSPLTFELTYPAAIAINVGLHPGYPPPLAQISLDSVYELDSLQVNSIRHTFQF